MESIRANNMILSNALSNTIIRGGHRAIRLCRAEFQNADQDAVEQDQDEDLVVLVAEQVAQHLVGPTASVLSRGMENATCSRRAFIDQLGQRMPL